MKYNDFKVLIFNEIVSLLSCEGESEKIYNKLNLNFDDAMIKSYVSKVIKEVFKQDGGIVEETAENKKIYGEFENFKVRKLIKTPYKKQVDGEHYISEIQPAQFIKANNLNFNQGNIVKYISRYQKKNGLKDLKKVVQYTLFEAFEEYPEEYVSFTETIKELID